MIFVSYSSSDRKAAESLAENLSSHNIRFWIDFREIVIGSKFINEIALALEQSQSYIILNPSSSIASYWVRREYQTAIRLRREGQLRLLVAVDLAPTQEIDGITEEVDYVFNNIHETGDFFSSNTTRGTGNVQPLPKAYLFDFKGHAVDYSQSSTVWLGYTDQLQALDNWLLDTAPCILITGPSGVGKSAFISNWVYAFQRLGYSFIDSAEVEVFNARHLLFRELPLPSSPPSKYRPRFFVIDSAERIPDYEILKVVERAANTRTRMIIVGQKTPEALGLLPQINLSALSERDAVLLATGAGLNREQLKIIRAVTKKSPMVISEFIAAIKSKQKE